jgi:hypothetical protein
LSRPECALLKWPLSFDVIQAPFISLVEAYVDINLSSLLFLSVKDVEALTGFLDLFFETILFFFPEPELLLDFFLRISPGVSYLVLSLAYPIAELKTANNE